MKHSNGHHGKVYFWNKEQYMVFIDCLRLSALSIMKLSGK